jgi:hypothetical protein
METKNPKITFVCCVESGPLETQAVRMIESLRRWGGAFANAPIIAVTPRIGPPLTFKTHNTFERLNVKYIRYRFKSKYSWFKFLNKPLALFAAEEHVVSDSVCWLDSDLLILDEPEQLVLNSGEDFLGCASDKEQGTSGSEDKFHPIWQENCRVLGMDIEDLPWIVTEQEKERIRIYWNGGIFVYRRSTSFAKDYLNTCIQLLDGRLTTNVPGYAVGINEMSAIGLAMVKRGLSWRALPYSHDYIMSSQTHKDWYVEEKLQEAKIIHYHDSMWPWFWETFIECLQKTHPEVADWLISLGPMKNEAPIQWRAARKILNSIRSKQELAYIKSCKVI